MLRYAIPEYRLPKAELAKEIAYIERLGVAIRCGVEVGRDTDIEAIRQGHDALFIGAGAPVGLSLGVDGEDLAGVIDGLTFLRNVASGEGPPVGKRAAVIGGGNTAVDCARTIRRLGCASVTLVYRRSRTEMPAAHAEVEALLEEGIETLFLTLPVRLSGEEGRLTALDCVRMELGEPDESGRRRPEPVRASGFTLPVDISIFALGQTIKTAFAAGLGSPSGKMGPWRSIPRRAPPIGRAYSPGETWPRDPPT